MYAYDLSKLDDRRIIVVSTFDVKKILHELYNSKILIIDNVSSAKRIKKQITERVREIWRNSCEVYCNEDGVCSSEYDYCVNEFNEIFELYIIVRKGDDVLFVV